MTLSTLTPGHIAELTDLLGPERVFSDPEKCRAYTFDEVPERFWPRHLQAAAVVFCENTEQVSRLLAWAGERRIPVTCRGAGTGLSGGAVPACGGIVLSFERMNRIVEVDTVNMTMTVEPGVITSDITAAAKKAGLLYAGDPCSADASCIGGNVAHNAGGNKVVRYGATGANVLGLTAVLADGSVCTFGGKRRKDVTGYDFVHLLAGSEGTLAVITEILLKLQPAPTCGVDLLVTFPDTATAVAFVPRACSGSPSSIELVDPNALELAERFLQTRITRESGGAHLIIQLEGTDADSLETRMETLGDLAMSSGAWEVYIASNRHARDRLWRMRKAVPEAVMALYRHYSKEDIVVPLSEIPGLTSRVDAICAELGLSAATFGHAGDGNLHVNLLAPDELPDPGATLEKARLALYAHVRSVGGTLSGEHGIGLKRRQYISLFLEPAHLDLIRRVKQAFDPHGILNPGKILPDSITRKS